MNKNLEEIYNNIDYTTKEDIGFPQCYMLLTTAQEKFLMELFDNEFSSVKEELRTHLEEMENLINEL